MAQAKEISQLNGHLRQPTEQDILVLLERDTENQQYPSHTAGKNDKVSMKIKFNSTSYFSFPY